MHSDHAYEAFLCVEKWIISVEWEWVVQISFNYKQIILMYAAYKETLKRKSSLLGVLENKFLFSRTSLENKAYP